MHLPETISRFAIIEKNLAQSARKGAYHPNRHHTHSLPFALGLVSEIFLARLQAGGCIRSVVVCIELGKTNEVIVIRILCFNSFQKSRCIQFAFEQIREIALHQSFCFLLDLEAGTRT